MKTSTAKKTTSEDAKHILLQMSNAVLKQPVERYKQLEMEAKFGTKGNRFLTKMDYDNVVKKLRSTGWTFVQTDAYMLRIMSEFSNKQGFDRISDLIRVEIKSMQAIQEYCRTNDIRTVNDSNPQNVVIQKKYQAKLKETETDLDKEDKEDEGVVKAADFSDFNFRVTLNREEGIAKNSGLGSELLEKLHSKKKVFRYLKRVSLTHPDYPFNVDLSVVKTSSRTEQGYFAKTYRVDESNVFQNPESYEIEIEVDNQRAKQKYGTSAEQLASGLQKVATMVLAGLQKTNFPVSYTEQNGVLQDYHRLLFEKDAKEKDSKAEYVPKSKLYPSDFIGPSLVTLDMINIAPLNSNVVVPNIREPNAYCVTEKADGDRHLLFVNPKGRIYLIGMNMNVIFTGAKTTVETCFNSLLDGELILHDKRKEFINQFAAFDIYYLHGEDVRAHPFINTQPKHKDLQDVASRLPMMKVFINELNPQPVTNKAVSVCPIKIVSKMFYPTFAASNATTPSVAVAIEEENDIFAANNYLLRLIADQTFPYEIDGLIFTPTMLGVGGSKILEAGPKKKLTWNYIFKWKPSEATETFPKSFNTIDFLVVTKKDKATGRDVITPIFENGLNNLESTQFNQYKTLHLTVGFDQSKHGYLNPCQDLLDDKFLNPNDSYAEESTGYQAKQFYPSDPYDPMAGVCNIMLRKDSNDEFQMFTEEGQVFYDQMVVEFRYDMSNRGLWRWVPMRVRYDKTAEFRNSNGKSVGANDYKTADRNWHSIHNPITERMIATGQGIPGVEVSDDVYYNSISDSGELTKHMRDFHNLYVKKVLIQNVSMPGNILIDFACGKAGDFPKWIGAKLDFVFGIDIKLDNLENRLNGACARYLTFKSKNKETPWALFVNGDSSKNIRDGNTMFSPKANQITQSVFGMASHNELGPAVTRQHGKGQNGFDVSSCQFSLHYMFKDVETFYGFVRNVAECTRLNGYFIATCYDGRTVFNLLRQISKGDKKEITVDGKKVWSVTKQYDENVFEDNDSSLGYMIDVYQDSINQSIPEYLVNFDWFKKVMDSYGFALVTEEDAKRRFRLPNGTGMFRDLFVSMEREIQNWKKASDYGSAAQMAPYEKQISDLNRYMVFQKTKTVNAKELSNRYLNKLPEEIVMDYGQEAEAAMATAKATAKAKSKTKAKVQKLASKLQLIEATEVVEEEAAKAAVAVAAAAEAEEEGVKAKKQKKETKETKEKKEKRKTTEEASKPKKSKKLKTSFLVVDDDEE